MPTPGAAIDVAAFLGGLDGELPFYGIAGLRPFRTVHAEYPANWKLIVDAFLEAYHIRVLHKDTIYPFFADGLTATERFGPHIQSLVARRAAETWAKEGAAMPRDMAALCELVTPSHVVFPNTITIFHPDYLSLVTLYPVGPETLSWTHRMLIPADRATPDWAPHWEKTFRLIEEGVFQKEDIACAIGIQRGLKSGANRYVTAGRAEQGIGWFHGDVARRARDPSQSGLTFARASTGFQRSRSLAMKAANSAGVLPTAIAASLFRRSSAAGSRTARAAAAASLSTFGRGQIRGRQQAVPLRHLEAGPALLGDGRHVGQLGDALRRAGGDAAELAGLDELQDRRRADRGRLQAAGEQVGELRAGAAIGHVDDEDAGRHLQVLEGQVAGAAVAGRAVVQLARPGARERDELLQVLRRHVGMDDVQARHLGEQRDRLEVLDRVVGELVEDERVDRERADVAEDQRVLVGRRGDLGHRDVAGAARLVVDVDALAEQLAELDRGRAGDDLRAAAGRERHDEADRLGRPGSLRPRPTSAAPRRRARPDEAAGHGERRGVRSKSSSDPLGRNGRRASPTVFSRPCTCGSSA